MKNKKKPSADTGHYIVGIGASAGGLEVIEAILSTLPPDTGMSFVVIQHLSHEYKSKLAEILQRSTRMPVQEIKNNQKPKPDHVYVIKPGHFLSISNERFHLKEIEKERKRPYLPIDHFFRSLASDRKNRAIAIVLTGTGSDGTLGIREIKQVGGFIIVQDPITARYSHMPESAIETGLVDLVLKPDDISPNLIELLKHIDQKEQPFPDSNYEELIVKIFDILRVHAKNDFSGYKKNTIYRRIRRRMVVNKSRTLKEYLELLKVNPSEVDNLFRELLIGVTSFFRDADSYNFIKEKVFPDIIQPDKNDAVRMWVAACSTGEEAYSLAILANEFMESQGTKRILQIFATDIDKDALEIARQGKYRENIAADVPDHLLKKYFIKNDSIYQIRKDIRDTIVFAEHSIIRHPPYSRMDLISCRNFLIYIESDIQKKVLNIFHYALNKDGYLFLGSSESQQVTDSLFKRIHNKARVFQKMENHQAISNYIFHARNHEYGFEKTQKPKELSRREISIREFAEQTALRDYMPPFIVLDKEGDILYSLGNCNDYLSLNKGEPTHNVISLAREGLKVPFSNAIRRANREKKIIEYNHIRVLKSKEEESVNIKIIPVHKPAAFSNLFIMLIRPSASNQVKPDGGEQSRKTDEDMDEYIRQMEKELTDTREYLKNIVEELETSNEELKSSNEESHSTNEELQSANEELESSKEEMQSLNEELETSNSELQRKIEEVTRINNDLNNFLKSTQIGTLFLDKHLNIKRFTPGLKKIINLVETDIGRSIDDFGLKNIDIDLIENVNKVLENLVPVEKEISIGEDAQFWMRILPYRTLHDKIEGVVITFTDITEKNRTQKLIEKKEKKYKLLFEHMNNGFALFEANRDKGGEVIDFQLVNANRAWEKMMQQSLKTIQGKSFSELPGKDGLVENFLEKGSSALKGNSFFEEFFFDHLDKYFRIHFFSYEQDFLATLIQDITQLKKEIETQQHLASIVESSEDAIFSEAPDGRILSWNEGAFELYGYDEQEAIGSYARDLYAYPENDGDRELIRRVSKGEKIKDRETWHKTKGGEIIPISITKSPIKDPNNKVVAISNIVKNISKVKHREEELIKAREASEQAATLKAAFLANMSHEIRTPLNSILGFTNLLLTSMKNEKQKKHVESIHDSGKQLMSLINDLVDVSRIEAGELPIYKTVVNINQLMKTVKQQFEGYRITKSPNIELHLTNPKRNNKLFILTDEARLRQILNNLLSNAFKYTDEGMVEFGYELKEQEKEFLFFVKDTGRGISNENHKIIFDRFKQSEHSPDEPISGTGLGLTIAQGICELLGGHMWLESEPEKGSVFYFTLPLERAEQQDLHSESEIPAEKAGIPVLKDKKILVVEDDPFSLDLLNNLLEYTGATLLIAQDGKIAEEIFQHEDIDLVLLDIRLPGKYGYELIKDMKSTKSDVPVIAQTAYAMTEEMFAFREKGFDDYITKPVDSEILYSLLWKYLSSDEE